MTGRIYGTSAFASQKTAGQMHGVSSGRIVRDSYDARKSIVGLNRDSYVCLAERLLGGSALNRLDLKNCEQLRVFKQ
jgi:hypothetical protein